MNMRKIISSITAAVMTVTCLPAAMVYADDSVQTTAYVSEETPNETPGDDASVSETASAAQANTADAGEAVETSESAQLSNDLLPYQDTSLSFEERAADLVARMTLEEKAAQTAAKGAPAIPRLGVHSYYYWREAIHGVARQGGATSFPSSLAMSNTWDRDLIFETMDITSTEARGKNNRYDLNYWNPTINMARDPRWGRNEESYGEDPYLTSELGSQAVKGMQGTDEKYLKTISTLKHYAANNCEGERQSGTSIMNESTMREYYSRAFRDIVESADPGAAMTSYNGTTIYRNGEILVSSTGQAIDYIASSANSYLVNDLLRRTYGFDGFIVGDCGAWDNLFGQQPIRQKLYPNETLENITAPMTVSKAIEAGSSLDCNSGGSGTAQVATAVEQGLISEDLLDIAVYELFLQRFKTGEFDDGATYQDIDSDVIESDDHVAKAEEAAEKSWVLLENNDGTLPLSADDDTLDIAVVGNLAGEVVLGDYSADMDQMTSELTSPIDGIESAFPNANVQYIGNVDENTPLFNIRNITLVRSSGGNVTLDLSEAENLIGMTESDGQLNDITSAGLAIIPDVDFSNVTDIQIEASSMPGMPNVTVAIGYGSASQNAANVEIADTGSEDKYQTNTGVYNGATGGYTEVRDMHITITANTDFTVDNYRSSLDGADYIIAYGGTTEADSGESNDRESIDLPDSQSHVQQLCDAYPEKTIVALQTVGQVNVEGFKDKCAALLWTSYNGQTQGRALGYILNGTVNPSGKLSTTWYTSEDLEKMPIGTSRQSIDGINYNFTSYELTEDINNPDAEYPGRTYQYYKGTPVYPFGYGTSYTTFAYSNVNVSQSTADANDVITVTADVTNTGSVAGTDVAQLYISVPGADGDNLPLKQLKGFERVELEPQETKTVSFDLDISDVYFFDETTQKNYVISGDYTAYVAGSSDIENANNVKFSVSGDIAETLKSAYAIPSGIKLYIATDETGTHENEPGNSIDAGVSVTLKNDAVVTDFAANGVTVSYSSSDNDVATVDENGIVRAGTSEGVATITVTASKAGSENVTTTFPVVTQEKERMSDETKNGYLAELDAAFANCPEIAYTAENWRLLEDTYNSAREFVENAVLEDGVALQVEDAINAIESIERIALEESYSIASTNSYAIVDNRIEYSPSGIGTYTATETTIDGTITVDNPATIDLTALDGGAAVDSQLIWSVERLDGSGRQDAEIDINTGRLTLYENGVFRITASDYPNEKSGSIVVYANLQIEGESADDGGGADLEDEKSGASGGLNAGSSEDYWLRFDGVKLDKLTDITFRISKNQDPSVINVSLLPNSDWIFATVEAPATGSWSNWTEVKADVNRNELDKLTLDENGCGTIYVQTNAANLDFMKLNYNTSDLDVVCLEDGEIEVTSPYDSGVLTSAVYDENGTMTNYETQEMNAETDVYTFNGFSEGDDVKLFAWENTESIAPLDDAVSVTYREPTAKELTVYNFSDSVFDSFFNSPRGQFLTSGIGMDGYGGWNTGSGGSYTYNGRTYNFTRSLRGGRGGETELRVYFTPDSDGVVTAIFSASSDRFMAIEQDGEVVERYGNGEISIVQANVTAGIPVSIYGGGSNKELYGVLFEADAEVEITTPSPTVEPTPTATPEPLPEIITEFDLQFENFQNKWGDANIASGATGSMVENTRDGDILYFGEQTMDGLVAIDINAAIRHDAGTATATLYAVDMNGVNVGSASQSEINALLTDENRLGSVNLIATEGSWSTYYDHRIRLSSSGRKGLFVKLNTTGKYCGNFDFMHLMYTRADASSASAAEEPAVLTAENANAKISVVGDTISVTNKSDSSVSQLSYNETYGKNVTFKKLVNWNGVIAALVEDNDTGATQIITSPAGTVWMDATPTDFAEADVQTSDFIINDMLVSGDQMYLGCDDGLLITMPICTKCATLKQVCDFDITELEESEGTLYLYGRSDQAQIDLSEARQSEISAETALELSSSGEAVLVDLRSAEEFAANSIDGAVNVPSDGFANWLATQSVDSTIIVYCASGTRSAKAIETALELGYLNVYNAGGIDNLI